MKFKSGDQVYLKYYRKPAFTELESTQPKNFSLDKVYEIDKVACRRDKTYTLKGCNTYVIEQQLGTFVDENK